MSPSPALRVHRRRLISLVCRESTARGTRGFIANGLLQRCNYQSLYPPDLAIHSHAASLERIRCRTTQDSSRADLELRAVIGQVTVDPSSLPALSGSCLCVHLSRVAQKLLATLNPATLPTSKANPGGTSLTRNSLSLRAAGSFRSSSCGLRLRWRDLTCGPAKPVFETRLAELRVIARNE